MKRLLIALSLLLVGSAPAAGQLIEPDSMAHIQPYWSPNGDQIAFASSIPGNFDIFVINLRTN